MENEKERNLLLNTLKMYKTTLDEMKSKDAAKDQIRFIKGGINQVSDELKKRMESEGQSTMKFIDTIRDIFKKNCVKTEIPTRRRCSAHLFDEISEENGRAQERGTCTPKCDNYTLGKDFIRSYNFFVSDICGLPIPTHKVAGVQFFPAISQIKIDINDFVGEQGPLRVVLDGVNGKDRGMNSEIVIDYVNNDGNLLYSERYEGAKLLYYLPSELDYGKSSLKRFTCWFSYENEPQLTW